MENSVLFGHDLCFDGFYTARFSKVDFVLVKEALSDRDNPIPEKINGLNYISITDADLKNVMLWTFPKADLRYLENYTFNKLKQELIPKENITTILSAKPVVVPKETGGTKNDVAGEKPGEKS